MGSCGVVLLARVFLCDVVACLLTLPFDTHNHIVLRAIRGSISQLYLGAEIQPSVAAWVGNVSPRLCLNLPG